MALLQRPGALPGATTSRLGCSSGRLLPGLCALPVSRRKAAPGALLPAQKQLPAGPLQPLGFGTSLAPPPAQLRQRTVMRSFLGVGAPEALLVAVVALVVFGPKGLADAAKSLGQTLRAFQPTIREVVEVSQEIKGTLEQELGLDEIRQAASLRPTPRPLRSDGSVEDAPGPASSSASASSSSSGNLQPVTEEQAKQLDPDIELKRAMSEQAAWGGAAPAAPAAAAVAPAAAAAPAAGAAKDLSTLSLEELEAELAKRKQAPTA